MIRPPFRNRIDRDKISRHSSQIAIRKASTNSRTQANSEAEELRNIRQTTFWVKKTPGMPGSENIALNNKRIGQSRDHHVLSIKLNTDHSDTDSTCQRLMEDRQKQNFAEISNKLALFLKSQKETGAEVNVVTNQNLPKLSVCHKLFTSLNKILKLATSACSSQFISLVGNHIQYSNLIFEKVLSFSHDFIAAQKSHNLITKYNSQLFRNIELEKQNSKLMSKCSQLQMLQQANPKQKYMQEIACLQKLNLSKLYANHHSGRQLQGIVIDKSNQYCKRLLKSSLDIQTKIGHFELINSVVDDIMNCKQGKSLLKELTRSKPSKQQNSQRLFDLSKSAINAILLNNFDFGIFDAVKQKIKKSMQFRSSKNKNDGKLELRQILSLMNEMMILKDINKTKSIMCQILSKIEIVDRANGLTPTELKQIEQHIEQGSKTRWTNKSSQIGSQKASLSRLSSKRFVNCANLYSRRPSGKNKQNVPQSQTVIVEEEPTFLNSSIQIVDSEAVLACYNFIQMQLDYLTSAISVITIMEEGLSVANIYDKLAAKQLISFGKNNQIKQKQAILIFSNKIGKHYACDHIQKRELILAGNLQLTDFLKQETINWLKQGNKLVLAQCDDVPLTLIS